MGFGDWDVMEWCIFILDLDPNCLVFYDFFINALRFVEWMP